MASWLMRIIFIGMIDRQPRSELFRLQAVPYRLSRRGPWRRPFQGTAGPGTMLPFGVTTLPTDGSIPATARRSV